MANDTRTRILDAMYDLVAEVGYDKASTAAVCEKAEINKGSLYYFFKNKEQLFLTLVDEYLPKTCDISEKIQDVHTIKEYKKLFMDIGVERIDYCQNNKKFGKIVAELYIQSERLESVREEEKRYIQSVRERNALLIEHGEKVGAFDVSKYNREVYISFYDVCLDGIETAIRYGKDMDYHKVWEMFTESLIVEEG